MEMQMQMQMQMQVLCIGNGPPHQKLGVVGSALVGPTDYLRDCSYFCLADHLSGQIGKGIAPVSSLLALTATF